MCDLPLNKTYRAARPQQGLTRLTTGTPRDNSYQSYPMSNFYTCPFP